jgi:hypothetical protein
MNARIVILSERGVGRGSGPPHGILSEWGAGRGSGVEAKDLAPAILHNAHRPSATTYHLTPNTP